MSTTKKDLEPKFEAIARDCLDEILMLQGNREKGLWHIDTETAQLMVLDYIQNAIVRTKNEMKEESV